MQSDDNIIKGRGAQIHLNNPYHQENYAQVFPEGIDEVETVPPKTVFLDISAKTIVNKVNSPDLNIKYSMNPYQGCEHGCIYCYARNSHQYWGYDAGLDFESKIMVKTNTAELLRKHFMKPGWKAESIVLSGNTDCYQPIEAKRKLSRAAIKVFLEFKNPLGVITKNELVCRDIDLLQDLAQHKLARVFISLTTLDESLRRKLEPRTSTVKNRLKTIEQLSAAGIPVGVMLAPIIPGLNAHEIPQLAQAAADSGAKRIRHTLIRLNGRTAEIFTDWLQKHYPDRTKKVIHQIQDQRGGKLNDSDFKSRMKGDGKLAALIDQMVKNFEKKMIKNAPWPNYNYSAFTRPGEQTSLF